MTTMQMYCLLKLDDVKAFFAILAAGFFIFGIVQAIAWGENSGPSYDPEVVDQKARLAKACKERFFQCAAIVTILLVPALAIPSTKEMAAILVVPKLSQAIEHNEKLKALPSQLVDLASQWIVELSPSKKAK